MRTISALILFAATITSGAPAQEARFGVLGSLVNAHFGGNEAPGSGHKYGTGATAYFSLPLLRSLAIRPALSYTRKGGRDLEGDVWYRFEIDYVELPVLLELRSPPLGPLDAHLFGGPVASLRIHCDAVRQDIRQLRVGCEPRTPLNPRASDLGVALGAGLELESAERNLALVLEVGWSRGLAVIQGADVTNRVFQVSLGASVWVGGPPPVPLLTGREPGPAR